MAGNIEHMNTGVSVGMLLGKLVVTFFWHINFVLRISPQFSSSLN
jgi:hypothetical protein